MNRSPLAGSVLAVILLGHEFGVAQSGGGVGRLVSGDVDKDTNSDG